MFLSNSVGEINVKGIVGVGIGVALCWVAVLVASDGRLCLALLVSVCDVHVSST